MTFDMFSLFLRNFLTGGSLKPHPVNATALETGPSHRQFWHPGTGGKPDNRDKETER
jgi:hypothetical protein